MEGAAREAEGVLEEFPNMFLKRSPGLDGVGPMISSRGTIEESEEEPASISASIEVEEPPRPAPSPDMP